MLGASEGACAERAARGLKFKPDTYDGTAPLRESLSQFLLMARANQWTETEKAVVLASCLRGKARSLLESCADGIESFTYTELKSKLELRFGESELAQSYYLHSRIGNSLQARFSPRWERIWNASLVRRIQSALMKFAYKAHFK